MPKKKWFWIVVFVILVALYLWLHYRGRAETEVKELAGAPTYATGLGPSVISDQLLVDLDDDAATDEIRKLERKYGLRLRPNSSFSLADRLYRSTLKRIRADRVKDLLRRLRREPLVEHAELDAIYRIPPLEARATRFSERDGEREKSFPNDPKYRYQWHLDQIGLPDAWPKATGKGVIVAVIDTGVAYKTSGKKFKRVPDLAKTEIEPGYDFVNNRKEALDDHGHGTHVAGTIAQSTNNGIGVAGTAYRAKIMPLKVLNARGFGNVADIAEAIRFAARKGAKVINMSLGANRGSKIMAAAVQYAHEKGVVVVCAAGNNGQGKVSFPAAYPGAIAVAATQYDRTATFYSNWGKEIDVAAPGGNTRVDQNGDGMPDGVLQNTIIPGKPDQNDYLLFMGTSMASPHVAGAAALLVQKGVTEPDTVEKVLKSTARHPTGKKWDPHYGAGIIDAGAALDKTSTSWGAMKLGLSTLLGLLLLARLRGRGALSLRVGPGAVIGLVLGSAGLFFLSGLGASSLPGPLGQMLTTGLPAWDIALVGPAAHGNPLFYSMLVPLALAVTLYGTRLRGLVFGLAVGVAGHLLFHVPFHSHDVTWIPNVFALDQIWLVANGLACLLIAYVVAKR